MTNTRLLSSEPTFRHLSRVVIPSMHGCEMGDEDDCGKSPTHWLTAPGSYVVPMLLCDDHAAEENFYFGTPLPA